ncbi:MAG: PAS domain-containing sensor histidine kinase, partial [Acidobacteriota bacterium]
MTLATRIRVGLLLLTGLSLAGPGAFLVWNLERGQAGLERRATVELQAALAGRWTIQESRARAALASLADELGRAAPWGDSSTTVPPLPAAHGLDLIWLLDADGAILECAHWPARTGGQARDLLDLPVGRPQVISRQVRNQHWTALVVSQALPPVSRGRRLVGGFRLERLVRENLADDDAFALALFRPDGTLLASRPWPFPVESVGIQMGSAFQAGGRAGRQVKGRQDQVYLAALQPLVGGGKLEAFLLAVRSLGPLRTRQKDLLATLAATAIAALFLVWILGTVLAGRLAAPLARLTGEAGKIAAGKQDRLLPASLSGEVGRLALAFNSMLESLRQSRQELARSERLAAWRDAARKMAHEVKNPLAPIRISVQNLLRARQLQAPDFDQLFQVECRTVLAEVAALHRLVDEFSRFARQPEPRLRLADPGALVRHVADLFADAGHGIEVRQVVEPRLPPILLDPDLMGQVLKNLVANALDAVPRPGGTVQVACRRQGGEMVLSVRDNGPGIPDLNLDKVLNPFFTTKEVGKGTGVGLSVSHGIVKGHHGNLEIRNCPEGGASFIIDLPLKQPPHPGDGMLAVK